MTTVTSPSGPAANARPFLHGTELAAIGRVLETGQYGHGHETDAFESELAAHLGVDDVVAVATGTAALHLALLAAGVGPGDEVVVPSLTFCASVQAILATGAQPRFVDVDPATLCVTAEHIQTALTSATRAVMPVLYGGRAVDLAPIRDQLAERDIAVVEDAAHAFGSLTAGRRVGATGDLTCFSFDAIKALTCGDGGAIVPRHPAEADQLRRARLLGMTSPREQRVQTVSYLVAVPGFRYHLSTLHAAIGRVQLTHFDEVTACRRHLWRSYATALANVPGVVLVDLDVANTVPFNCVVRVPASVRDTVHARLHAAGIQAGVHYPPNHLQPAFARWSRSLPATEAVASEILSLPFHPNLTDADLTFVVTALAAAVSAEPAALHRGKAVPAGQPGVR
ncbi:DegT/DnrJ/EryC1/StrS aminotransferase family protein [Amycolatopsis sp. WQ 127309]|uniref:DegT/DnrJ/EryC1/StrS family aminotransferase n=1 Tax=Amycolatopsis sp. WQ 127309 TaxID=2932773 RepID=UPI001FF50C51|nr:DegT/DnrJ/EryC1/StrS family aminotransferase [Amycolatopsis sp. WQ 127309]UOZ03310.1 DegT/DnrJ/EryC1/StrS family aminotransferase [Amycolatopsis sp. WQ 127309]